MDWLEAHSPHIDWVGKFLTIETTTGQIRLQGHPNEPTQCAAISSTELASVCRQGSVAHLIHVCALGETICFKEVTPTEVEAVLA